MVGSFVVVLQIELEHRKLAAQIVPTGCFRMHEPL
jgi:hypothetical protein